MHVHSFCPAAVKPPTLLHVNAKDVRNYTVP